MELRLRNLIGPEEMPYTTRTGRPYDSGDYPRALRMLCELVGRPHRAPGKGQGPATPGAGRWRRRGIGYAFHVETTGLGPSMG